MNSESIFYTIKDQNDFFSCEANIIGTICTDVLNTIQ